ncbi:hypothetical protein HPP92_002748 [Vanilla planifolia]|uniref:Uncharacterized protein n=1 Tax=Vanilla planifolia TaxID=51239 RepID=A0A835VN14_VANPL|nr:hypothetical protein HPP92_002748 [Vanilla planifolia]
MFPFSNVLADEKLNDVLGHFQKSLKAVCLQRLWAPSVFTQPKSPVNVKTRNGTRSPCNLQPEIAAPPATASIAKPNAASALQTSKSGIKGGNCISKSKKKDINQHEVIFKSETIGDQRSLKVRIKVGPGNVLPRNNPDIYSDLGLDVSISILEDSPGGSRELS